jgi:hypothetical protein
MFRSTGRTAGGLTLLTVLLLTAGFVLRAVRHREVWHTLDRAVFHTLDREEGP